MIIKTHQIFIERRLVTFFHDDFGCLENLSRKILLKVTNGKNNQIPRAYPFDVSKLQN